MEVDYIFTVNNLFKNLDVRVLQTSGAVVVALFALYTLFQILTNDLTHLNSTLNAQTEVLRQLDGSIKGNTEVLRGLERKIR